MKTTSAKQKGRKLQKKIRDLLTEWFGWGTNDCVSRSSGAAGTDLILSPRAYADFPFAIECKNVERFNIKAAWEQAEDNADKEEKPPMVIWSCNGWKEPLAIMKLSDFLWYATVIRGRDARL